MTDAHGVARDQLRSFIERIERLEEEKKTIADDIKDVKLEAKGLGFDVGAINAIIKLRKIDADKRAEQEAILDTYMAALGMIDMPYEREDHDPTTGEIIDGLVSSDRSDGGLQIVHKHTDIRTSDGGRSPVGRPSLATRGTEESVVSNCEKPAVTAVVTAHPSDTRVSLPVDDRNDAAANAGGDHEVDRSAQRAGLVDPTSNRGEGDASAALPVSDAWSSSGRTPGFGSGNAGSTPALASTPLRPHCKHPGDTCGGYGRKHCHSCERAAAEMAGAA